MICFRFDVDTRRGLVVQTPPLLELLARHRLVATFFVVMGPEANLLEILRLRLLADPAQKSPLNVGAKGGALAVLRAALLPRRVGVAHRDLLRRMVDEGHEVQPHGWSHIQWQRNLGGIDVADHLARAMDALGEILGQRPDGFASPGRSYNEAVLAAFDAAGLLYAGDMDGTVPFVPDGHRHLQLPVTHFATIAEMRRRGLDDDAIVAHLLEVIAANPDYCCIYEHPDDLGARELAIFGRVFGEVAGREVVTLREAAQRHRRTAHL